MRINIKGNAISPSMVAEALKTCEGEYGLKVKSATLYVRFEDDKGNQVEPTDNGHEIVRDFVFSKTKEAPKEIEPPASSTKLSAENFIRMFAGLLGRMPNSFEISSLLTLIDEGLDKETAEQIYSQITAGGEKFNIRKFERQAFKVLNGEPMTRSEQLNDEFKKWQSVFSKEIIDKACQICVDFKGKEYLPFINKMLEHWNKHNLKTLEEVNALVSEEQAKHKAYLESKKK